MGSEEEKHHLTLVQWGGSPPLALSLGLASQVIHKKVFGENTKVVEGSSSQGEDGTNL